MVTKSWVRSSAVQSTEHEETSACYLSSQKRYTSILGPGKQEFWMNELLACTWYTVDTQVHFRIIITPLCDEDLMRVAGRIIPFLFCAAPPVLTEPELVRSKAKLWTHICSFSGKTVVCSYMCAKKKCLWERNHNNSLQKGTTTILGCQQLEYTNQVSSPCRDGLKPQRTWFKFGTTTNIYLTG